MPWDFEYAVPGSLTSTFLARLLISILPTFEVRCRENQHVDEVDLNQQVGNKELSLSLVFEARSAYDGACGPRQSGGGGKTLQNRAYARSPLLKITALRGKLTFGDLFSDSGVAGACTRRRR